MVYFGSLTVHDAVRYPNLAAEDLADRGIGLATVNPGPVLRDFHRTQWQDVSPISASQPWSTPERIAEAVMAAVRSSKSPLEIDVPYLSGKLGFR